jgi:DNA polymerase-3 subunit delta'
MTFEDIIGQNHLKSYLQKNILSGRIPHAQLFVGKDGLGALPVAVAYASFLIQNENPNQKVNALENPDIHYFFPVVKKEQSSSVIISKDYLKEWREFIISNPYGSLNDWYSFIGAGNKQGVIAVDEAQAIIKTLAMKSFGGGNKILIIWHAEKMTTACANKLLKWFEEPNQKTNIILITEQEDSLLKTIQSRCQSIHMHPLSESQIINALVQYKGMDEIAAKRIARRAEGNLDSAYKLINQEENSIEFEPLFIDWVRTAFQAKTNKKSINKLMAWSETVAKLGREMEKQFLSFGLDFFRQALLFNYGASGLVHLEISDKSFSLEKFSEFIDAQNIEKICNEIESAIYHIERNANGKIVLTDLSIKLTRLLHQKA